jgi:ABC-2 type transport system ATP-binding protein
MDEAEEIADEIAIIDHGKIIESGTLEKIKANTGTDSLEEAFLKLTGRDIRDENGGGGKLKFMRGMGRRRRN